MPHTHLTHMDIHETKTGLLNETNTTTEFGENAVIYWGTLGTIDVTTMASTSSPHSMGNFPRKNFPLSMDANHGASPCS